MSIIKDVFAVNRKTFFNPTGWIGASWIADQNKIYVTMLKSLFTKPVPLREETFEAAMKRLNLDDAELATGISKYQQFALLFVFCGLIALFYGFYLLFRYHTFSGWLLAMAMTGLFLSQAYQYDFWAFQMQRRTLGLSFDAYAKYRFGDKGQS